MSDTNYYILFYSNKCENCRKIVPEIEKSCLSGKIKYFSIDTREQLQRVPTSITSVPTLLVRTKSSRQNQIYTGNEIKGYLEMSSMLMAKDRKKPADNNIDKSFSGELLSNSGELSSKFSDSYSFINEDCSAKGNGGGLSHNFDFIGGNSSFQPNKINYQSHNNSVQPQISNKEDKLNKDYENFMAQRAAEIPRRAPRL